MEISMPSLEHGVIGAKGAALGFGSQSGIHFQFAATERAGT
jgi:hypothetical protein